MNPSQVNRNKNPLLSCAVTGGFEEFTSSGFVLAAAEKPVFTIGAPAISDTDNFSDVSLDRDGVSDTASSNVEAPAFYSPLAELDSMGNLQNIQAPPTLDLNQDQQQQPVDGNLNPISAALAQLPNAASTVFSTFSSIIKGSTSQPRFDEQSQAPPMMSAVAEPVNPGYMLNSSFDPNAPAPSFFSPTDDSLFKKQTFEPVTNNTFRLGGHKKKTYAHIPGLSSHQQQAPVVQNFSASSVMPPMPPQPTPVEPQVNHFQDYQPPMTNAYGNHQQKEPEKSSKFSLTSLLPSQLLEKIPATKGLFGPSEPSYDQQQYNENQDFTVMTSSFDQPPPATANFFNQNAPPSNMFVSQPDQTQTSQAPVNFFKPQQFNTSPFAQPKSAEQIDGRKNSFAGIATPAAVEVNNFSAAPAMLLPPSMTTSAASQIPPFNPTMFNPTPFASASTQNIANDPPKIDAVSADTNRPPPTFFNPIEASGMFRPPQSDDGKPKNPYSSSRLSLSRGTGLYKTRPASDTAIIQQVVMPPMPEPANFGNQNMAQFPPPMPEPANFGSQNMPQFPPPMPEPSSFVQNIAQFPPVLEQQKIPSRPPSIPPLPAGNYGFNQHEQLASNIMTYSSTQPPMPTESPMPTQPPMLTQLNDTRSSEPPANSSMFFNPANFMSPDNQPTLFQQPPQIPQSITSVDSPLSTSFFDSTQKVSGPMATSTPPNAMVQQLPPQTQQQQPPVQHTEPTANSLFSGPQDHFPASSMFFNQSEASAATAAPPRSQPAPETPVSSLFFNPSQANVVPQPTTSTPPLKKSDLNVPEVEIETSSIANFFQSSPSASRFSNASTVSPSPTINFFQPEPSAPDASLMSRTDDSVSNVSSFFSHEPSSVEPETPTTIEETECFNPSFLSPRTPPNHSSNNDTDISDKFDGMSVLSDNIGSTLSLFATSELDSSLAQKTAPFESLIPKYLDTQVASTRSTSSPAPSKNYRPVYRHWFYQNIYWHPFAMSDSLALDEALMSHQETVVTDGGRFEVNLTERRRSSIYWLSGTNMVRRCSWFYKNPNGAEANLIPFEETVADFMESEYEKASLNSSSFCKTVAQLPDSEEFLIMKDATNIEYHQLGQVLVVKRGVDEFVIEDGEEAAIDHLIISVSNFGDKIDGSADDLRSICYETIQHYYSEAFDCGQVGRLEVLPLSLNSVDVLKMKNTHGVIEDAPGGNAELMKSSTYQDVIMKTAFYSNQDYYNKIMIHLAFGLNEIVSKFTQRNLEFKGEISLIATSFEALFLFDLLLNQESAPEFWKLKFHASNFYTFGMPSNLLTIRNAEKLHPNFELKNCKKFLNVVHRLDPIAQRIEPLIKPEFSKIPPESIENETADRTDYTIADGSSLECFSLKNYFTSELIILRITNEIYGSVKMDSGSL